jgi:hypothetical protein
MKPLRYFLVFGICVAATVVLTQAAFGASGDGRIRPGARLEARVSTLQPERHSALVASPARMRLQMAPLGPRRGPGSFSALDRRRVAGFSTALDRRRVAGFSAARIR